MCITIIDTIDTIDTIIIIDRTIIGLIILHIHINDAYTPIHLYTYTPI
jgi:hypothetical protein